MDREPSFSNVLCNACSIRSWWLPILSKTICRRICNDQVNCLLCQSSLQMRIFLSTMPLTSHIKHGASFVLHIKRAKTTTTEKAIHHLQLQLCDFGFVDETLTALFIHDRSTKTMHAVYRSQRWKELAIFEPGTLPSSFGLVIRKFVFEPTMRLARCPCLKLQRRP